MKMILHNVKQERTYSDKTEQFSSVASRYRSKMKQIIVSVESREIKICWLKYEAGPKSNVLLACKKFIYKGRPIRFWNLKTRKFPLFFDEIALKLFKHLSQCKRSFSNILFVKLRIRVLKERFRTPMKFVVVAKSDIPRLSFNLAKRSDGAIPRLQVGWSMFSTQRNQLKRVAFADAVWHYRDARSLLRLISSALGIGSFTRWQKIYQK